MTSSPERRPSIDALPPALSSMWRLCKLGYRHEPALILVAFTLALLASLPDALVALWFMLLGEGVLQGDWAQVRIAVVALGLSATATWFLVTVSTRVQRRFRDKVTIALESHVATLLASIATIAHQERPDYLDRLSVLRHQVFMLDHMYMSLFATCGWILRLAITIALLVSIHPLLVLLALFALPPVLTSTWRPAIERDAYERGASPARLARHLFDVATTAAPGKEVRVTGIGDRLLRERRQAWEAGNRPIAARAVGVGRLACRGVGALWRRVCRRDGVRLVGSGGAGRRRAPDTGGRVASLVLCRGHSGRDWLPARNLDGCRTAAGLARGLREVGSRDGRSARSIRLAEGIRFEHVSFAYPGTDRFVLDDITLDLPAGKVIAIVGENGAGKSTLVKLLAKMYAPTSGRILVDSTDLAAISAVDWRARLAGAFQDFFRFELRARQAVGIGDLPAPGARARGRHGREPGRGR